ncbi:DUF4185 domain-containing protein [Lutimaribacter sp. EGI FJ00015]|uniref:DUF4185 domain-containing protein n=1 Tax=Lutimaribacter degradans TaxID=2945989 RepID=A0ACC5ZX31_9RHOB|nr:DUF4185 domain-containing protein [Lutimaribacter sp. EGI FJ00013]MCM2562311.1 DUF4185 domain-containing protein [Lutimaribacter sp. EGI FJ00013]MCO0613466.1 DUF4185 domain-containing protein [Lutimaribacter sp. EGI FJ00015]
MFLAQAQAFAMPDAQQAGDGVVAIEPAVSAAPVPESTPGVATLSIGPAEMVQQLTGPVSANETDRWNVHGTDLGHMIRHKGALYMVFGDTYGADGSAWRSSTMARISDQGGTFDFAQMISDPDGNAKELIRSAKIPGIEWTVIPTNGISLGERMVLHYMSVRMWTSDGRWLVSESGLAYSDDDGHSWNRSPTAVWPNGSGFEQVAFVDQGELIYSFGIPAGRFGGVRLRRVARDALFDPAAYRYWDGSGWVSDHHAAATVVPAPAGELSVAWSETHHRWLMMYLDESMAAIVLRTAPDLVGPWSAAQTVAHAGDYPGLYAPYIVPGEALDTDVRFTMSRWKPLYNVFLMRAPLSLDAPVITAIEDDAETEIRRE